MAGEMDQLQQLVETLRVLAQTNEPNRVVLIEKAINEYLNDKAGIVGLSLERLYDAIDREEAVKRRGENWSIHIFVVAPRRAVSAAPVCRALCLPVRSHRHA
jgi:hypothetical protein